MNTKRLSADELQHHVAICEPLYVTDRKAYDEACRHAVEEVTKLGEEPFKGLDVFQRARAWMLKAIELRNAFYHERVKEWRVVHG